MRVFTAGTSAKAFAACALISALINLADVKPVHAGQQRTVEGVWRVTSSKQYKDGGYSIVRQGAGYNVTTANDGGRGPYHGVGMYYGSPTDIMANLTPSFEALMSMVEGKNIPSSAIGELAGKVTLRFRFTLSPDGRSLEQTWDVLMVYHYAATGRLARYEIMPFADRATLARVDEPAAPPAPVDLRDKSPSPVVDPKVVKGGTEPKRQEAMTEEAVIGGLEAEAVRLGWDEKKRDRLDKALKNLNLDSPPTASLTDVARARREISARGQDSDLARAASRGEGPAFPAAGTQTSSYDCTIFALANAAGLPYGVVAARANELMRQAAWRSADERANPQKAIESAGLNGGEVVMLAEVFGRAEAVKPADFAATLKNGRPIMVNMAGHEVVLTKTFVHDELRWYEVMNSYTAAQERQYVTDAELTTLLVEKGVSFTPEPGTVPEVRP
jgi:hypothetical protein